MKHSSAILATPLAFAVGIAITASASGQTVFEPPYLLPILNTTFLGILPFLIAATAGRVFFTIGNPSIFLLGCGVMALGTGGLISGWLIANPAGPNVTIITYNSSALLSSLFHLLAGLLSIGIGAGGIRKPPRSALIVSYAFCALLVSLVSLAAVKGLIPPFIIQGQGPTVIGRTVLSIAFTLFIAAGGIAVSHYFKSRFPWLLWYGAGLMLIGVGLAGVLLQPAVGSPVGWVGRFSQYTGAVYLFIGVLTLTRSASRRGMSLKQAVSAYYRDAEANYKTLVETACDGIISLDQDCRVLLWNPGAERLFGFSRDEACGRRLLDLIQPQAENPSDLEPLSGLCADPSPLSAEGSAFFHFEAVVRSKDGRLFPTGMSVSARQTTDGLTILCIVRDITSRRQADTKLRRSKELSDALTRIARMLYSELDTGRIISHLMNEGAAILGSDTAAVSLREDGGWTVKHVKGIPEKMVGERMTDDHEQHAVLAITSREPVAVSDAFHDERFNCEHLRRHNVRSVLALPLIAHGGPLGVLFFNYHTNSHTFSEVEVEFARQLAMATAAALESARLFDDLKRADKVLRDSEQRLALAASEARIGMFEWDVASGEALWNEQHALLFGIPTTTTTTVFTPYRYGDWAERVHPEDLPRIENGLQHAMSERLPYEAEYRVIWPDESVHWLTVRGVFHYDEQNKPSRMRGMVMDITERKQAEIYLEQMRDLLSEGQRIAHMGSFEYDGATRATVWSEEEYRIYGFDPAGPSPSYDVLLQKSIHPDDVALLDQTFITALQNSTVYELEHRIVRPDGSVRWVYNRAHPYFDEKDKLLRYVGTTLDITERKQAEEALQDALRGLEVRVRERTAELANANATLMVEITERNQAEAALRDSEERLRSIFENSLDGIILASPDEAIFAANRAAGDMLGWSEQELCAGGRSLVVDASAPGLPAALDQLRRTGQYLGELTFKRKDGATFPVEVSASLFTLQNGEQRESLVFRDITERRREEEQRQRMVKAESLNRMAGAIAHHFNNQLAVVLGNIEMAQDELPPDHAMAVLLQDSLEAARRATEVSTQMLAYLGMTPAKMTPFNLIEACREVIGRQITSLPQQIKLETAMPSEPLIIKGNQTKVEQALSCLITNATEAIGEDSGTIRVTLRIVPAKETASANLFPAGWQPGSDLYACMEVSDTGCGIEARHLNSIFDPFFSTKFTGRGLGLAVLEGTLRMHRGAVAVESQRGKGSTFRVFWPLEKRPSLALPKQDLKSAWLSEIPGYVLVVDDEPMVRKMAETMLSRLGCRVLTASDGFKAIEIFREHKDEIQLVLLDLTMPGRNGWETLTALRALRPDIIVILASGYDEAKVMTGEHPETPQAFLHKPYGRQDLQLAIGKAIGTPSDGEGAHPAS